MAKYVIYMPAYVRGAHLGEGATPASPRLIDLPNDVVPSKKWDPADEPARVALEKVGVKKSVVKGFVEPEAAPEQPTTNTQINEARGGKVTGRLSDKSPV